MATRFTPMFSDGSDTPVTSGSYDTPEEATAAGRAAATAELRFVGVARHLGHTDLTMLAGQLRLGPDAEHSTTNPKRWSGVVTGWKPGATNGFITDTHRRSWFVSRSSLPPGHDALPVDTRVTFTGSPHPAPGKRYPQAQSVEIVA